jgi:hypothetical protein
MRLVVLFVWFGLFSGCGNIQKVDTAVMKKQMGNYKIKKILEVDIMDQVEVLGEQSKQKIKVMKVTDCQPKLDSNHVVWIDFQNNPDLKGFSGKLKELLEANKYAILNNEKVGNNIQKIDDQTFAFTFPVDKTFGWAKDCSLEIGLIYFQKSVVIQSINTK